MLPHPRPKEASHPIPQAALWFLQTLLQRFLKMSKNHLLSRHLAPYGIPARRVRQSPLAKDGFGRSWPTACRTFGAWGDRLVVRSSATSASTSPPPKATRRTTIARRWPAKIEADVGPIGCAGEQRRHHLAHKFFPTIGEGPVGCGDQHQPEQPVQRLPTTSPAKMASAAGRHHQHLFWSMASWVKGQTNY